MAAASSRFRSVRDEDLDSLLVKAVPEKTKAATKYGMKIMSSRFLSRDCYRVIGEDTDGKRKESSYLLFVA